MNFKAAVLLKKNDIKILNLKKPELNKAQLFVKIFIHQFVLFNYRNKALGRR